MSAVSLRTVQHMTSIPGRIRKRNVDLGNARQTRLRISLNAQDNFRLRRSVAARDRQVPRLVADLRPLGFDPRLVVTSGLRRDDRRKALETLRRNWPKRCFA